MQSGIPAGSQQRQRADAGTYGTTWKSIRRGSLLPRLTSPAGYFFLPVFFAAFFFAGISVTTLFAYRVCD